MNYIIIALFGLLVVSCSQQDNHVDDARIVGTLGKSYATWVTNSSVPAVEATLKQILQENSISVEKLSDGLLLLRIHDGNYLLGWNSAISEDSENSSSTVVAVSTTDKRPPAGKPETRTYLTTFVTGGCLWIKSETPIVPGCIYGAVTNGWHRPILYPAGAVTNLESYYSGFRGVVSAGDMSMTDTY